jgi:hypothetical protein
MVNTYSNRFPGVEGGTAAETKDAYEIARRIAVASGESRPLIKNLGRVGRVLGPIGVGLSVFAFGGDLMRHDWSMAAGDALTVAGGGAELYALAVPGATIAGAAAVPVGLALGGVGLAVTSGISAYRAYKAGDTAGMVVGGVGVAAGVAITVGAIGVIAGVAAAPVVLAVGLVAAAGVGLYHLAKWLF